MRCHGLFYGGNNYAAPNGHDEQDWEDFASLKHAADTFWRRVDFDPQFPCVDEEQAALHIYFSEDYHEDGPDRIITLGPRGGIRIERS